MILLDSNDGKIEVHIENVIAAVPTSSEATNEYSLLYAFENAARESEAKVSPMLFGSIIVSDFPAQLIERLQPKAPSFWPKDVNVLKLKARLHVVISTGSGTGLALAVWEGLLEPLLANRGLRGNDYSVHTTSSANSVTELVESSILPEANQGIEQAIILLSGDGGVVDIVNALLSAERSGSYRSPTIALLPLGTGNALANSAVVGKDRTMGLRTMLCGTSRELPIFRATFSPGARLLVNEGGEEQRLDGQINGSPVAHGAVVCSWGLHATLVADSDTTEYRKHGAERFKMAAKEALFPSDGGLPHAYRGKVSIMRQGAAAWDTLPGQEHGYVLATLVSQLEAGFTISPASQPLDGKLRLIHFGHISGQEATEIMTKAYQGGKHVDDERVGYEEIEGVRIEVNEEDARWRRVCIDGKILRVEAGGWVEVRKIKESVVDLVVRPD